MRTRNAGTPKTPASQKKTPASKKAAGAKTPASNSPAPVEATPETATPKSSATPPAKAQPPKSPETEATPSSVSKPEPAVEQAKDSVDEVKVSPTIKGTPTPTTTRKVTKRVVKKKVLRPKTPASAKATPAPTAKAGEADEVKVEEGPKDEDTTGAKDLQKEVTENEEESVKQEELGTQKIQDIREPEDKGKAKMDVDEPLVGDGNTTAAVESGAKSEDEEPSESSEVKEEERSELPKEEVNAEKLESEDKSLDNPEKMDDNHEAENDDQKPESTDDNQTGMMEEDAAQSKEDDDPASEGMEEYADEEGFVEPGDEDLQEDDEPETADEMRAFEEEHKELAAAAKERKVKKEHEIFVGGLDREVVEDDLKKAFEKAGEVVEVRLLKDPLTNKNRGFAFVRFATKDQAKGALSEMKNPVIRGKRCGTAPNEDNDTLFLGNICNTWTKEAIKQKLKDYNVEGVDHITLVQDPRHEGLSRGFCFIQFACHADAMFAYKRLQKPDAIFGHTERTAKVAFAEPLQEPDPEVMAKVKSVFVDGLPPHWDEDRVRKHFKVYGDIERITLARNMSTAKRKDFGFVDFTSHEAAVACIADINSKELVDGNSKTKVRSRLSNPMPKTQAVKGGMCGGFRIGRPTGRSFGRTGPPFNRPNFQHQQGRPFRHFNDPVGPYGRRVPFRGGHGAAGGPGTGRPNFGGPRHGVVDRGVGRPGPPRREPFPLDDGGYSRPFMGRHYDDPYYYDDTHGLKRPYYMIDQDPAFMEPSRVRPRFDYSDSGRGAHFRDTYGAGSSLYSSGYYGPDYGGRPHSSYNGRDRSYGGGSGSGYYY